MGRKLDMNIPTNVADPQPSRAAPRPSTVRARPSVDGQDAREEPFTNKVARVLGAHETPATKTKQVANRRPGTRSRSGGRDTPPRAEPTPAKPVPVPTAPASRASGIPKLKQGHSALHKYYENASAAFAQFTITDPQIEYDFISAFIAGLANKKAGDKVIQALRAVHPARNKLDGGVEVMCGWEDIEAGFKRAGLDVTGAKEEIKRKKRTLNVRTQLETGFST